LWRKLIHQPDLKRATQSVRPGPVEQLGDDPKSVRGHFVAAWAGKCSPRRAIKAQCLECVGFVPYSTNERQQSRWGGLDFDAHNGESDRTRQLAFVAFRVLLNAPGLAVILETSGSGGWHVWAISPDFHDTREWIRLLKSVAATIGAPVAAGVCETGRKLGL